jgi:hypothetical protein
MDASNLFGVTLSGPPNAPVMASLEGLRSELRHALSNDGILIAWSVHTNAFTYFIKKDKVVYHKDLKNIVQNLRSQDFYIRALPGETITFEGRSLYPLLLQLNPQNEYECPAYFILMQQGILEHTQYVPYWFTSESSRDGALSYIHRQLENTRK